MSHEDGRHLLKPPSRDFLFVDESGDLGDGTGGSTSYYTVFGLHVADTTYKHAMEHLTNYRYFHGVTKELKSSKQKTMSPHRRRFMEGLSACASEGIISCSCVFLRKLEYTGPYLHTHSYGGRLPIRFRNFVLKQLLYFHFEHSPIRTEERELVLDRFEMSLEDRLNLEEYLRNDYRLPTLKHITHADSTYVEMLQVTDMLAGPFKQFALHTADDDLREALAFVKVRDITFIDKDKP
ncbi:MAG: hypothetical protein EPO21_00510 [Chloroflexota bacterium]|nr:MAG: hypothetical protein EPO21_00510 [Chloroflexota bacterium]